MQLEDYFAFEKGPDWERIRVKGTRVDIDVLLDAFNQGVSAERIQQSFPTVTREQVYAAITYYLRNQQELDDYLRRGRAFDEAAYQEWKATHQTSALEERLRKLRETSAPGK